MRATENKVLPSGCDTLLPFGFKSVVARLHARTTGQMATDCQTTSFEEFCVFNTTALEVSSGHSWKSDSVGLDKTTGHVVRHTAS